MTDFELEQAAYNRGFEDGSTLTLLEMKEKILDHYFDKPHLAVLEWNRIKERAVGHFKKDDSLEGFSSNKGE